MNSEKKIKVENSGAVAEEITQTGKYNAGRDINISKVFDSRQYNQTDYDSNPVFRNFCQLDRKTEIRKLIEEYKNGKRIFFYKTDLKHRSQWLFYRFYDECLSINQFHNKKNKTECIDKQETELNNLFYDALGDDNDFQKEEIYFFLDKDNNKPSLYNDLFGKFGKNIKKAIDITKTLNDKQFWLLNFHIDCETDNTALKKLEKEFLNFWLGESEEDYKSIFEKRNILIFFTIDIETHTRFKLFFSNIKTDFKKVFVSYSQLSLITKRHCRKFFKSFFNRNYDIIKTNISIDEAWEKLQPDIAYYYLNKKQNDSKRKI